MGTYRFTRQGYRGERFYQCVSSEPGDGECWVKYEPKLKMWATAEVPHNWGDEVRWAFCPVAGASATRKAAVVAHFFYFNNRAKV